MRKSYFLLGLVAAFAWGCDDDDDNARPLLNVPTTYDGANYDQNAATELAVRDELSGLVSVMKQADGGNSVTLTALTDAYDGTTLASVATPYYDGRIPGWLADLAAASGGTFDPFQAPDNVGEGGLYGSHTFDERGVEPEQLVEKGLFGAAMYNHALGVIDMADVPADVDKLVAIFGASPEFPNGASNATRPDKFSANYAARRTPAAGGLYFEIRNNLLTARAAAGAGDEYDPELEQALNSFKMNWERAMAATAINYVQTTITKILDPAATPADLADALHAHSEAVGFMHGFRTVSDKIITDAQIDDFLELIKVPAEGEATAYQLITNPGGATSGNLADLQAAIDLLQQIYGFTDEEVESFRKNWINEEGR